MVLSSFLSAIKGRQGARLPWGQCKGRDMLGVSQPLGTLSAISSRIETPGSSYPDMLCSEISSSEEEIWLLLPVLSLVRSCFPGYVAKHRGRDMTRKRAWESVLGTSHLSFSLVPVSPRFFVVNIFCRCLGVAQSCCDKELRAASLQQCWTGMARGCSCPKCV